MIKLASEYKNQGMNYDKAIKGWNTRAGYVDRVKRNSQRFNIFQQYTKALGGPLMTGLFPQQQEEEEVPLLAYGGYLKDALKL